MCDNLVSVSLVKRKEETADLDVIEVASTADSISLSSNNNRRKVKHPMSRRTLRQRKIHSLKRQIQIKEKMLEVLHKVAYTHTAHIIFIQWFLNQRDIYPEM